MSTRTIILLVELLNINIVAEPIFFRTLIGLSANHCQLNRVISSPRAPTQTQIYLLLLVLIGCARIFWRVTCRIYSKIPSISHTKNL
ncbi:hypothetical protein F5884DRAFT_814982 [Xylogone sp. PMI_703]|nr:hypothetical protein F5884DRAFT_814982 [Xylogone sp. PMI_703]